MSRLPRFQMFVEAEYEASSSSGWWRFSLEAIDGELMLEAEDHETSLTQHRLELIGLVRALEALEQRSRVQLVTESRYLSRGLRVGLPLWRENEWRWERFGEMTPIKDCDLWQRVDHALNFHELQTRLIRIDGAHASIPKPASTKPWNFETTTAVETEPEKKPEPAPRSRIILPMDDEESDAADSKPAATRVYRRSGRRNRLGIA